MHDEQKRKYYEGQNSRLTLEGVKSSVWKETLEITKQSFCNISSQCFQSKKDLEHTSSLCAKYLKFIYRKVSPAQQKTSHNFR